MFHVILPLAVIHGAINPFAFTFAMSLASIVQLSIIFSFVSKQLSTIHLVRIPLQHLNCSSSSWHILMVVIDCSSDHFRGRMRAFSWCNSILGHVPHLLLRVRLTLGIRTRLPRLHLHTWCHRISLRWSHLPDSLGWLLPHLWVILRLVSSHLITVILSRH